MNKIVEAFANEQLKTEIPAFNVGDTIRVHNRIKEGSRERIQMFEGTVIAKKHGGVSETFTVRRVAHGCGVERVFPLHSPVVEKVEDLKIEDVKVEKKVLISPRGEEIPAEVKAIADERFVARQNKDWAKSDELRDKINALGYDITPICCTAPPPPAPSSTRASTLLCTT